MSFSSRMNDEERNLAESHAGVHGFSLADAAKQSPFEKMEDEYDRALYDEAHEEYLKSGQKSRLVDELFKEIGL